MFLHRRRRKTRRLVALLAAVVVQVWSLAPVSASVIYCIGEDGHSGFELVKAGARGCAACCHDPSAEGHADADSVGEAIGGPVSECTDIALSSASGVLGKIKSVSADQALPVSVALVVVERGRTHRGLGSADLEPPRGSPQRLRRHTVLLI